MSVKIESYGMIKRNDSMYRMGLSMPNILKETAQGGLAATPTARKLKAEIFGKAAL